MGMPRMISDFQYDTAEPRNLNDADLEQDATELPLPRPETEITIALGMVARRRMFTALGTISNVTANVKSCDNAEIIRADAVLHAALAEIKTAFRSIREIWTRSRPNFQEAGKATKTVSFVLSRAEEAGGDYDDDGDDLSDLSTSMDNSNTGLAFDYLAMADRYGCV
ncbi:MAG: hypothetical protein Q9184_002758 [Pyrenodesmia sp. 2 TL-2023]